MRKTISANNNGSSFKFGHQQQHNDLRYPIFTGSSPSLHNSHGGAPPINTGAIYKRGLFNNDTTTTIIPLTQQRENNSPNAYYYSSTLNTPKKLDAPAAKNIEQYHTKTTTLRSNKEPSSDPDEQRRLIMDNRGGLGSRRQTAASAADVHAFSSAAAPGQYVVVASYNVEHLASFAVGKHFGLVNPADGIRKLKQMERNNAICPVSMVFTLHPDRIAVLEQNGQTLVEEFPLLLVTEPTAHISSDPDDFFNNVLLFIVKEHELTTTTTAASRNNGIIPTEMHIFQCLGISAQAVAEDLHHYSRGHFHQVRSRARNGGDAAAPYKSAAASYDNSSHQEEDQFRDDDDDDGSVDGNDGAAKYSFEMDVNTLNRCFDDIERFVCRIQAAAIAQREVEFEQRNQSKKRGSKKDLRSSGAAQNGFAQLRAQIPSYVEFAEIFQKFKLCFNLLAKLREHIHEPSAPELLHFLFTPLMVILDACQWGLGQPQLAQQVYSPLLSLDACQLLRAYLFPKEVDVWRTLGKAWNTAPDDWPGPLPPPYRPVFLDGFAPYGYPTNPTAAAHQPTSAGGWDRPDNSSTRTFQSHPPMRYSHNSAAASAGLPAPIHRGTSAPPAQQRQADFSFNNNNRRPQQQQQRQPQQHHHAPHAYSASTANLAASNFYGNNELERINREKERLELERRKVLDKERELLEQERRLREESARLDQERRKLHADSNSERRSLAESDRPDFYRGVPSSLHASPGLDRRRSGSVQAFSAADNGRHQQHQQPTTAAVNVNSVGSGGSSATATTYAPMPSHESTTAHGLSPIEQISPRQTAFVKDMVRRGCKVVQVTYDRNACNAKELSVNRGEYLEVLNDARNWWECRNVHRRQGFVPHTILSLLSPAEDWERQGLTADRIPATTGTAGAGAWAPPASSSGSSTPDMIRQRRGPKGEFRYF